MAEIDDASTKKYLDIDSLNELRTETRLYPKLDLAYLVASGTVITALKINNYDLPEYISAWWLLVVAFLCLMLVDYIVYSIVFFEWVAAKIEKPKRRSASFLSNLVNLQPFLHLLFISGVISGTLGFSSGAIDVRNRLREHAFIQDQIDHFILIKGGVPASIEELVRFSSSPNEKSRQQRQINHEPLLIEPIDSKKYRLIFAGEDKKIGTLDDEIDTSDVKLQKILDDLRDEEIQNHKPTK